VKKPVLVVAIALLAIAAIAVPATATKPVAAHAAAAKTLKVGDFYFVKNGESDPTVTVKKGTKVTWKFVGQQKHDVSARGPKNFKSKLMAKGTYSYTVTKKGTYNIICTLHSWMQMKLKVK